MKYLLSLSLFFFSVQSHAQALEAKSLQGLVDVIEASEFTYKGTGKLFGYNTTQSCMYASKDVIIFKNYCFPVRNYPASGYTIISAEYGTIGLYEERMEGEMLKRDITLQQFPVILKKYLPTGWQNLSLENIDAIQEEMYNQYFPGCWSTSFSFYTETNDVDCTLATSVVVGFEAWATETQGIVLDGAAWKSLFKTIQDKLPLH